MKTANHSKSVFSDLVVLRNGCVRRRRVVRADNGGDGQTALGDRCRNLVQCGHKRSLDTEIERSAVATRCQRSARVRGNA
jgi:hypothetical protein